MKVVTWNSRGDQWSVFWNHFISPNLDEMQTEDVIGALVEASWAPWMVPNQGYDVDVSNSSVYEFMWREGDAQYKDGSTNSFCTGIHGAAGRSAIWVPWATRWSDTTNSRCSMGAACCLVNRQRGSAWRYKNISGLKLQTELWRPAVRIDTTPNGKDVDFSVFFVHLVSGWRAGARDELFAIFSAIKGAVPQGNPALLVGDMNIDITGTTTAVVNTALPAGWRTLRTGGATQQSGGELDYGFLYDPKGRYANMAAPAVQCRYATYPNDSDHSVLLYTIPEL